MNTQAFENLNKRFKCYLVGAMERTADGAFGSKWRDSLYPELIKRNIFVFDPTKMEKQKTGMTSSEINNKMLSWISSGHKDLFLKSMELIWNGKTIELDDVASKEQQIYHLIGDKDYVAESDFLIFGYNKGDSPGGTYIEVALAFYMYHIPIYTITKEPMANINKSILYHVLMSGQRKGEFKNCNPIFNNQNDLLKFLDEKYGFKDLELKKE